MTELIKIEQYFNWLASGLVVDFFGDESIWEIADAAFP